ncbi:hypothetical protein HQ590_02325 [bacterium]|nr:hypothetical protein [bacterium]
MNTDETESELKQLFREQREQDARHRPAFQRLARPAESDAPGRPGLTIPWLRLAAAAAVLVAVGVLLRPAPQDRRIAADDWQQWAALSNWQAPTDSLLTVSTTPWGSTITTPSDSWTESITSVSENSSATDERQTL